MQTKIKFQANSLNQHMVRGVYLLLIQYYDPVPIFLISFPFFLTIIIDRDFI